MSDKVADYREKYPLRIARLDAILRPLLGIHIPKGRSPFADESTTHVILRVLCAVYDVPDPAPVHPQTPAPETTA